MKKEMDEVKNAIKGKTNQNLDRMVKTTDSPFMTAILECPLLSKFHLPQLEPFDGLKNPLDHFNTFKTTLMMHKSSVPLVCSDGDESSSLFLQT